MDTFASALAGPVFCPQNAPPRRASSRGRGLLPLRLPCSTPPSRDDDGLRRPVWWANDDGFGFVVRLIVQGFVWPNGWALREVLADSHIHRVCVPASREPRGWLLEAGRLDARHRPRRPASSSRTRHRRPRPRLAPGAIFFYQLWDAARPSLRRSRPQAPPRRSHPAAAGRSPFVTAARRGRRLRTCRPAPL